MIPSLLILLRAPLVAAALASVPPPTGAQVDFKGIIGRAMELYVPRFAAQGITLSFVETRTNMITGAGNRDDLTHATLQVDAGYYADPKIAEDGFRFMVCHELGHLVASAPHREAPGEYDGLGDDRGDLLVSAEGQADYYAAAKCMRLVLEGQGNAAYVRAHGADPVVAEKCGRQFQDAESSALCQRIAMGGKNFLDSFARSFPNSFDQQAPERPARTLTGEYPTAQCRLDTVVAGALCPVDKNAPTDGYDPSVGFCTSKDFPMGARPACWFKE